MKYIIKTGITLMLFLAISTRAMAQETTPADTMSAEQQSYNRALMNRYGVTIDVNLQKAVAIFSKLARNGYAPAMVQLGEMYQNGEGTEKDLHAAWRLYRRAAQTGDTEGMCHFADMYREGIGVRVNCAKAFDYYFQAAIKGSGHGCYGAGYLLYKGFGVKQDYQKAEQLLLRGSELGDASCDFLLGSLYANGYLGEPDFEKAEYHYDRAAKGGHGWTIDIAKNNTLDSLKTATKVRKTMQKGARWRHNLMKETDAEMKDALHDDLTGHWTGTAYTYDWSGEMVTNQEQIALEFEPDGAFFTMKWTKNDTLRSEFMPDKHENGQWMMTRATERSRQYPWVVVRAKYGINSNGQLCARLTRYSHAKREPLQPTFVVLDRDNTDSADSQALSIAAINLQGGDSDGITIRLSASADCTVEAAIFDVQGIKIADCGTFSVSKGINTLTLHAPLQQGLYLLKITGNGCNATKNFIHQ